MTEELATQTAMGWRVNSPGLMKEIVENGGPSMHAVVVPVRIMMTLWQALAKRATELNDRELNAIMLRLSLYSISDPESDDFDQAAIQEYLEHTELLKKETDEEERKMPPVQG